MTLYDNKDMKLLSESIIYYNRGQKLRDEFIQMRS